MKGGNVPINASSQEAGVVLNLETLPTELARLNNGPFAIIGVVVTVLVFDADCDEWFRLFVTDGNVSCAFRHDGRRRLEGLNG